MTRLATRREAARHSFGHEWVARAGQAGEDGVPVPVPPEWRPADKERKTAQSFSGMRAISQKKEAARLERLRDFEILDTPPERSFNNLARLAARMFGVPFSAVSFMDEYRQWHKASHGLRRHRDIFREESFCSHAILSDEVMVVRDASEDPRFAGFPMVAGETHIRFYAGAPLKTPDGYCLGTLWLMDRQPRSFSKADRKALADLAAIVIDELMLRRVANHLHTEVNGRKQNEKVLSKQHRLLQRLSTSQEDSIRQRTVELTRVNDSLRAEISQRERLERDRLNLLGLVEESPDFIGLASLDAIPLYVNEAGRRLVGLDSMEEALRAKMADYFQPEDQSFVVDTMLRSLRETGQWEGDFHFRHFKTGALIPMSWKVFYVRDPATGVPVSMATIARDITERQRVGAALRESEERFRHLVEQAGDAFFVCDLDGNIIDVNQAACESLGYRREELLGLPAVSVDPTFDPAEVLPRWRGWKAGHAESFQTLHRRKDGTTFPVEARVSMIHTDGRRYILALVRNVTERQRTETALQQAKEEAEKANRAKSEFLSRMSHELRIPLNAILGFGRILLGQVAGATQKDCAAQVVSAGHHLLGLINEVLDIARIETGQVELSLESIRVENLVAETLDLIRPQAQERGLAFDVSLSGCGDCLLLADRKRCKQVLLNLLSNAVKYSPASGRVRIVCRQRPSRGIRISVSDTGPGIAADKIERLFVAFDRLGAERSAVPGTGLGLTLSKHLAEAMGGSIGVRSTPGAGSTFWLQLPGTPGTAAPGPVPPLPGLGLEADPGTMAAGPAETVAGTVLYIEDNDSNLRLIEHLLASLPRVRLLTARSGGEGLKLARARQPVLILLDLHLPDMPGWEVLARLQSGRRTRRIPVVGVSADATPGTAERLIKAGARAYLTKPLNIDALYQLLPRLGLN